MEIVKAEKKDFKRILPFINRIFHKRFPVLLPKLYLTDEICSCHYLALEDEKILGTVASIPNTFHIPGADIKAYGIGMVSVDPSARGRGVMDALLTEAVSDAKQEGGEIAYLSGNRQRYERYGFVPSGSKIVFQFSSDNFKYMPKDKDIRIKKSMTEQEGSLAKKIFDSNEYRFDREDFAACLKSWKNQPFCVYLKEEFIGYGVLGKNKTVKELCLEKGREKYLIPTLSALGDFLPEISLEVEPWRKEYVKAFSDYAGKFQIDYADDFCILNYASVLEKLMNVRKRTDGVLNLGIDDETYTVSVSDGKTTVEITNATPDISYTKSQATLFLFSALSGTQGLDNDWFGDVGLYMSDPDNV